MVATNFAPLLLVTALLASDVSAARVDPGVHRTLRQQKTVNLIVTMKKGTQESIKAVKEASFTSRGALIEDMVSRLQKNAESSQSELSGLFAKEAAGEYGSSKSFWISNQLYVDGATVEFLERLAASPSVGEIREENIFEVPEIQAAAAAPANSSASGISWGVEMIKAPVVWAKGNTGEGVVVANIDTGVLATHEAIKGNFRSKYGWFDAGIYSEEPYDDNGHGTHTMGTIAGTNGIGVAPGVTWMTCKGCMKGLCFENLVLECMQFMTCPTDTKGKNPDCSKAPHVVNSSLGGAGGQTTHKAAIDAWHAAGIIPVFSNGNSGKKGCSTAGSPGDYANVIGVGATNSSDGLADFSSKGPAVSGIMKPEISAPGVDVRSAWYTGDSEYHSISGTSMAAPHVTGAVALLLAANPGLKFDEIRDILIKNTDTESLMPSGYSCGNTTDGVFPNNMYGYGRLNVNKAVGNAPVPQPTSPGSTTPAPSTKTPVPTTSAPPQADCSGKEWFECTSTPGCDYSWNELKCLHK
ncbi:hypothetical protein Poli38472_001768 [Pythium oligandrum]|uniref:subtilisin n=1 Tax=Pythium oligandrum TaxID=41045 RepID=A0A8K1CVE4_PYTOL|nr:hypothetical protein Poli38472_001768 [Pythium oligandrum]|eukprot:TMW69612.1 hypothetical protein Poli38472_001768 [Pythium oligandrum]